MNIPDFNKTYLYRITHLQNVPHILQNGITHRNSPNANSGYINIGDSSLINTRNKKYIFVNNGGQVDPATRRISLGEQIPFYFGFRMPMLYVIQHGYKGVTRQSPENIVYCVCTLQKIIDSGLEFFFTDGHAIDSLSSCYDASKINDIRSIIDTDAINAIDWTSARDLKRKKEAEFLVNGDIPANCVVGFICYNTEAKSKLLAMNIEEGKIYVDLKYYF